MGHFSRSQVLPIGDNLTLKSIINVACSRVSIPLNPLKKGDFDNTLVPPLLRGARGDLDFEINKRD